MLRKFLKDRRGDLFLSIPSAIIAIIGLMIVTTSIGVSHRLSVQRELQGIADTAAVGALTYAVDTNSQWGESFVVDKSIAKRKFNELFEDALKDASSSYLTDAQIRRVKVYEGDEYGKGQGIDDNRAGGRSQYLLEAIVVADYPTSSLIDNIGNIAVNYYNVVRGSRETFTDTDNQMDGEGRIIVRGVGRTVLR